MANNSNKAANYSSIRNIKDYWLKTIAPNYFNFEDINIPVQYNGMVDYYDLHDTINRAALSIIGK